MEGKMNWEVFSGLRNTQIQQLAELNVWKDGKLVETINQGSQPFASVGSWAIWQAADACSPIWPDNETDFVNAGWQQDFKQSVIVIAKNPSGIGQGPLWGNFHVPGSNDKRLCRAFHKADNSDQNGPLGMLSGAYMTDFLKTERGAKIGDMSKETKKLNAQLFEAEMKMLGFYDKKPRLIVFLGKDKTIQNQFGPLEAEYQRIIPIDTDQTWIHHHSSRTSDVERETRWNIAAAEVAAFMVQHQITQYS
jgi:hypothetical protein